MKIGILHHDLEFAERKIAEELNLNGVDVTLYDVRSCLFEDLLENDVILNRVYASVANRDYKSIPRTLELLKKLELNGVYCLNSYETSLYDYNKYQSFLVMKEQGVPTPESIFINSEENLEELSKNLIKNLGLPLIIKRNIGGRGKDISKLKNYESIFKDLKEKFELAKKEGYYGGFIAQEYVKSYRDHDCRLGVIDGNVAFSYSRSLISFGSDEKWLASCSNGSIEGIYEADMIEKEIGLKSSNIIGAKFNELDIMFTIEGPVIIENNPTPNYFDGLEDHKRIKQFVEIILDKFRKEEQ